MIFLRLQFLRLTIWMMKFELAFSKDRNPVDISAIRQDIARAEADFDRLSIQVS